MKATQWKDPIVEEVRTIRKKFDQELKKDPHAFMQRALKEAVDAGFKISSLKPVQPNVAKVKEAESPSPSKKSGRIVRGR